MLNEDNCILVCDYHIGEEEFQQALAAEKEAKKAKEDNAEKDKEVSDKFDELETITSVDNAFDQAFGNSKNYKKTKNLSQDEIQARLSELRAKLKNKSNNESLIQHNYSIFESYLLLNSLLNNNNNNNNNNNIKNEADSNKDTKAGKDDQDDQDTELKDSAFTNDATLRFGQVGKVLKTAFLIGPSESIKNKGKIYVGVDGQQDKDEIADYNKELQSKTDKDNKKNKSNNESLIQHNYSIFESYLLLNKSLNNSNIKNEADSDQDTKGNKEADSDQDTKGNKEADSDQDTKGNKEADSDQDTKDNKEASTPSMRDADDFIPGTIFKVKTVLDGEGFSEWRVFVSIDVPRSKNNAIISALKSGEFKKAYEIAGESTKSDGLVPMSCKTYITKKPECGIPWLGHCRYGFLPGAEDNDPAVANTLFLAVAPFNAAKGGKPDSKGSSDEAIVFTTAYNVTGDISDGKVGSLVNFIKDQVSRQADRLSGDRPDDYDDIDDELTKYLKDRFKCIGDSSMYKQFLQIREYLSVELKTKDPNASTANLQINTDESTTDIKEYANQVKSKKALIFY